MRECVCSGRLGLEFCAEFTVGHKQNIYVVLIGNCVCSGAEHNFGGNEILKKQQPRNMLCMEIKAMLQIFHWQKYKLFSEYQKCAITV